jgi:nicotinamidase-related amidase
MIKTAFISVDLQYDFTRKGGSFHNSGRSPTFVREVLIPHFVRKEIGTAEIISDYRQPRPGDPRNMCHPGSWGYSSEILDQERITVDKMHELTDMGEEEHRRSKEGTGDPLSGSRVLR